MPKNIFNKDIIIELIVLIIGCDPMEIKTNSLVFFESNEFNTTKRHESNSLPNPLENKISEKKKNFFSLIFPKIGSKVALFGLSGVFFRELISNTGHFFFPFSLFSYWHANVSINVLSDQASNFKITYSVLKNKWREKKTIQSFFFSKEMYDFAISTLNFSQTTLIVGASGLIIYSFVLPGLWFQTNFYFFSSDPVSFGVYKDSTTNFLIEKCIKPFFSCLVGNPLSEEVIQKLAKSKQKQAPSEEILFIEEMRRSYYIENDDFTVGMLYFILRALFPNVFL